MNRLRQSQTGSALIVSLIFLLLMTLIGTAAMRSSTMQEQMAGNSRDWNVAFQASEAALREAESFLLTSVVLPAFNDAAGLYQVNSPLRPAWTVNAIDNGNGIRTYATDIDGTSRRPRYYIEQLGTLSPPGVETETGVPVEEVRYFRVTAVGYGGAVDALGVPIASVVLSTVFRNR
jgi:type IV pilus assembly protein PilX